ncbi:two-component system chemotaxis response regulator CheB [Pedobacter sp. UYP30]|uniref:chemotaxis protein CheB n=1 Tax=Pedobacter sp. UYP30 TaxID=1756400 RepID=UPI0033976CC7
MAQTVDTTSCKAMVIGGSAGSLNVLLEVLPLLKADIDFPILIVVHRKPGSESMLVELLQSRTLLSVKEVEEKNFLKGGIIYLAPANYHVLIEEDKSFSLDYSEKVNYSRPSIDVAFQSAAEVYKEKLVGILLSGSNADGTEGLKRVGKLGGTVVIQNPDTAIMPYMPEIAISTVNQSLVIDADKMADYINLLNR